MDEVMDAVERFRSGLLLFLEGAGPLPLLGLLPFILFFIAFSVDKMRTAAHRPLDDEEEPSEEEMSSLENTKHCEDTLYLDSIPGMTESILDGAKESIDDCTPEEKVKF